jgi:hypothetical protein
VVRSEESFIGRGIAPYGRTKASHKKISGFNQQFWTDCQADKQLTKVDVQSGEVFVNAPFTSFSPAASV